MKNDILKILRSDRTVFSFKDILLASKDKNPVLLRRRLNYYIKNGELYSIRKGFYAKDENYSREEMAVKMYTPSYVSFETVLTKEGVIFQHYGQIFVASYLTRQVEADKEKYVYRKIKDCVLTNNKGIENKANYSVASKERAFLDMLYLNRNYHFDNLSLIDWKKVLSILPIYSNKRMEKEVKGYIKC